MSEIDQENQQFELDAPAMFEIQILFHPFSNVHHRLIQIYIFCIITFPLIYK